MRPQGTGEDGQPDDEVEGKDAVSQRHTMTVIAKIYQLITPLRDDPQGVLQECDHDQEPPNGWKISASE